MADQTRRNAVEHAPQHEAAARRDQDARLLIVGRASLGEWLERRALDLDALAIASVAPSDHLVNEAAVGGKIREVARAAQQQLVAKRLLEVTMRALDRAVLVRDATIVARRRHAVMGAQLLVALGEVLLGNTIEIAECRRQAVAAMLFRHAAQRPQRVLQAFRERHKALAAEHHMGMLEAGERQPEVVEPVIERLTRDRDAEPAHVGEVGQAHPSRRMLLAEDHIAVGTVERPPAGDAALQGPAHARGDARDAGGKSPRRSPPRGCRVRPPASARSRCPTPRRAGRDGGVRAASSSATAAADRLRSDRRWRC